MAKSGYVYLLASKPNGTLYIGVTNDLVNRIWEHKRGVKEGFTKRYGVHRLVHVEVFADIRDAIRREKQLKKWNRAWKQRLIRERYPTWRDLCADVTAQPVGMHAPGMNGD